MRILIVSPIPISYPPKDGHSMAVFYRSYFLKKLANIESDIIVPESEESPVKNLIDSGIFNNVFSYPMNGKWKSLLKSLFSSKAYTIIRSDINNNEDFKKIISNISKNVYQGVVFDHSFSYALYEKLIKNLSIDNDKIIYWSHNIDYMDFKNLAIETDNLFRKTLYCITYKKLKKSEPDYIKKFTKIVSVSNHETKILKEINPNASVYWIPPILPEPTLKDFDNKKYLSNIEEKIKHYQYRILFTGILKKSSNIMPAIWFATKIFPLIKDKLNACFILVGQNPSKEIINLEQNNKDIFLFPNVPFVVPFYELSDLVVVPLCNPAGIKLKLIEALKHSKKVVARPEALLGAGLENIITNATEPEEFGQKCIDALEGKIDYNNIWKKFEEIYDNKRIMDTFVRILEG